MRRSEAQGVSPSAASYNMLLGMLQVEGQDESVRALQAEMQQRGLAGDAFTESVLGRSRGTLSKARTYLLGRLIERGETAEARQLFDGLLQRGCADAYSLSAVLKCCRNASEQLQVLARSEASGVTPSLSSYNSILLALRREGREEEARELHQQMQGKGFEGDGYTRAVLERPAPDLSRQRTAQLHRLLAAGEEAEAVALFNGLVERGHADRHQLAVMRKLRTRANGASDGDAVRPWVRHEAYEVASNEY